MHERHMLRVLGAILLGATSIACGGDDDEPVESGATTEAPAKDDSTASPTAPPEDAAMPTDCSEITTAALAEAWGAEPILDVDDSFYEEPIEELRCEWFSDPQATEQITLQLSIESNKYGYYGSIEAAAAGEHTTIEGFDDGRLYGDDRLMLGMRNGFVVVIDASGAPSVADGDIAAIALDATPPQ